jgi:hypothetical protein
MVDILEWVMDAELFEKFSSGEGQISIYDLLNEGRKSGALKVDDIFEYNCLYEFLDAILRGKSIAYYNKEILKEYSTVFPKLPKELCEMLNAIISNENLFKEVEKDLDIKKRTPLMNTVLKKKIPYITVAHFLIHKKIVSTCNDIDGCYRTCAAQLVSFQVDSKKVCDAWAAIKNI